MPFICWRSGGSYSEMYGNECNPSLLEFLLCQTFFFFFCIFFGLPRVRSYDELTKLSSVLDIFRS